MNRILQTTLALIGTAAIVCCAPASVVAEEIPIEFKLSIPPMMALIVDTSQDSLGESTSSIDSATYPTCSYYCSYDTIGGLSDKTRLIEMKEVLTGTLNPATYYCCNSGYELGDNVTQLDNGFMDNYASLLKFMVVALDYQDNLATNDYGTTYYMSETVNLGFSHETSTFNPAKFPTTSDLTSNVTSSNATAQSRIFYWISNPGPLAPETPVSYSPVAPAINDLNYFFTYDSAATGDAYESCRDRVAVVLSNGRFSYDDCYLNPDCAPYPDGVTPGILPTDEETALLLADHGVKTYYIGYHIPSAMEDDFALAAYAGGTCDIDPGADNVVGTSDDVVPSDCFYNTTSQSQLRVALEDIAAKLLEGSGSRTKTVTTTRTSFRTQETGMYEVSASFDISGDGDQTWTGHLERVTFKCDSGELQPDSVLDFADTIVSQVSRTFYVANSSGTLVGVDTTDAENAYSGAGENPFTDSCVDSSYLPMYSQVNISGSFSYYDPVDNGMAIPDDFYCDTDADCNSGRTCEEGACRDTTVQCSSTIDCCTDISGAINASDLCLYTCQEGYCTDMAVVSPCTSHSSCSAGNICWGGSCEPGVIRACEAPFVEHMPLGAIHHSNPVIMTAPELDLSIPAYEDFRVANEDRDTILFTGGNDGMLHAFLLAGLNSNASSEGEELWAFIPTALHGRLTDLRFGSGDFVDGTAVVKDIRMYRDTAATPQEEWKTVLIGGLREGGQSYYALDVTDPNSPSLLWEIINTDTDFTELGYTYAQAAMGAVYIDDGVINREKAVAFLPGGVPTASAPATEGAAFYVVDLETGAVIKEFNSITSTATALQPITGTPVVYNGFPGTRVTRVFVGDEAGRLLRVDVSDKDPANWSIEVFFDPTSTHFISSETIEPVLMAPALAQNASGQLVLTYGNGDVDALLDTSADGNFAVSLTETFDSSFNVTADENWFVNFSNGEKMTGSPVIFNSVAYFPTFVPGTGNCDFGTARLWAPHFTNDDGSGNPVPVLDLVIDENSDTDLYADFATGTVIYGLEIASRPACVTTDNPSPGVYTFNSATASSPQLIVQTGTTPFSSGSSPTTTTTSSTTETTEKVRLDLPKPPTTLRELSWALIYE